MSTKTRRPMINYYANLTATVAFYYSVLVQHRPTL